MNHKYVDFVELDAALAQVSDEVIQRWYYRLRGDDGSFKLYLGKQFGEEMGYGYACYVSPIVVEFINRRYMVLFKKHLEEMITN